MNKNILRTSCNDFQFFSATTDGSKMSQPSLVQFIYSIIRENAKFDGDGAHIFASDLSLIDKKIFLSYLIDAEDYEYYCKSSTLLNAAIDENKKEMQEILDFYADDVWHEDMREVGINPYRHADNGEIYYRR